MNFWRKKTKAVFAAAIAVLVMNFTAACSSQEQSQEQPVNTEPTYQDYGDGEEISQETLPPVEIEMPEYELTYSGEFQDLIVVKQLKDQNALEFSVKLSESEVNIFTLMYNTDEGELVTVLEDAQGNRIPVAFQMAALPEGLSPEDQAIFCTAQEAVNEIVASLVLK